MSVARVERRDKIGRRALFTAAPFLFVRRCVMRRGGWEGEKHRSTRCSALGLSRLTIENPFFFTESYAFDCTDTTSPETEQLRWYLLRA